MCRRLISPLLPRPLPPAGRRVDSPGDAAPIPPGLPIGYKETSGGVWTAHTPNNWVELKFF